MLPPFLRKKKEGRREIKGVGEGETSSPGRPREKVVLRWTPPSTVHHLLTIFCKPLDLNFDQNSRSKRKKVKEKKKRRKGKKKGDRCLQSFEDHPKPRLHSPLLHSIVTWRFGYEHRIWNRGLVKKEKKGKEGEGGFCSTIAFGRLEEGRGGRRATPSSQNRAPYRVSVPLN